MPASSAGSMRSKKTSPTESCDCSQRMRSNIDLTSLEGANRCSARRARHQGRAPGDGVLGLHSDSSSDTDRGSPRAIAETVEVGGRSIHLECKGAGSPTVVLQSGYGNAGDIWSLHDWAIGITATRSSAGPSGPDPVRGATTWVAPGSLQSCGVSRACGSPTRLPGGSAGIRPLADSSARRVMSVPRSTKARSRCERSRSTVW